MPCLKPRFWIIASLCIGCGLSAEPSARPNILLVFADDLGWKDTGFAGNDFHETPRIDRLAAEGMVFSNGYAAAGNCAPSRACLLSGTYTPRHHVFAVRTTERGPKEFRRLIPTPNKSGLAPDVVTLADALKTAGYTTGIFGKWHLDGKDGAVPAAQGFDVVYDPMTRNPNRQKSGPDDPKGAFSITRHASAFMEKSVAEKRPFFAYVSHHAIHSELQARPETLARFKAKTPGKQHADPLYAACTFDLDAAAGMLLEKIKTLGIEADTLVVFTSDNGATQQSSQEPLRGNKGGYYEGGIRKGDWKLHLFHEEWQLDGGRAKIPGNHAVELYHIARDIGEQNDLAATEAAKRNELLSDLLAWIERTQAPMPAAPNPAYDPAAAANALATPVRKTP